MRFEELPVKNQIALVKSEVERLVISIFDDPPSIKGMVKMGVLTKSQARITLRCINGYNACVCGCCRKMDIDKFRVSPIEEALYPILDMAQTNVKAEEY